MIPCSYTIMTVGNNAFLKSRESRPRQEWLDVSAEQATLGGRNLLVSERDGLLRYISQGRIEQQDT
jgi:hypothetical protein